MQPPEGVEKMLDKKKYNVAERFWNHPLFNEKVVGMNFGFMAKRGFYDTDYAKAQPAEMAKQRKPKSPMKQR